MARWLPREGEPTARLGARCRLCNTSPAEEGSTRLVGRPPMVEVVVDKVDMVVEVVIGVVGDAVLARLAVALACMCSSRVPWRLRHGLHLHEISQLRPFRRH